MHGDREANFATTISMRDRGCRDLVIEQPVVPLQLNRILNLPAPASTKRRSLIGKERVMSNEVARHMDAESPINPQFSISAVPLPLVWAALCVIAMAGWAYGLIWVAWRLFEWAGFF
jgi:hypothetical protein